MYIDDNYLYHKFIQYIAFSYEAANELENGKLDNLIFEEQCLKALCMTTSDMCLNNLVSVDVKDNLLKLTQYIRDNANRYAINRKEVFDKVNVSITFLNKANGKSLNEYLIDQYYIRSNSNNIFYLTKGKFEQIIEITKKSIAKDFPIILTHSFDDEFDAELFNHDYYVPTIKALLEEQPEIFIGDQFFERVMMVLQKKKETKQIEDLKTKITKTMFLLKY